MPNPAFGSFDYPGRNGSELRPNIEAALDREALSAWRALQALARVPGVRAPADRAQWGAWASGEPTSGPRYESAADAAIRARWAARRVPKPAPVVPPWLVLGPWRRVDRWSRATWVRCPITFGRERKTGAVEVSLYSPRWEVGSWPRGAGERPALRGEATAVLAACDAALTAAGVRLLLHPS